MCVSITVQVFTLMLSYQGCASVQWLDRPQIAKAPKEPPLIYEFWAERIESTDADEDGHRIYIFRNPTTNRKNDATATCGDTGPQERQADHAVELKIIQTTSGNVSSFSVACKPAPETG